MLPRRALHPPPDGCRLIVAGRAPAPEASDDHVKTIASSVFKARCPALLDEVAATGEELVITKRGKPVARLSGLSAPRPLTGSVVFHVSDEELSGPTGETWEAENP